MSGFETMNQLAASMMHDLRNPLAAICGGAEVLLDANLGPEQTRRVSRNIHRAAVSMRRLLAEFAQFTQGYAEVREWCNLRGILTAAWEALSLAAGDDIAVLLNVAPRIRVAVARGRMERVFVNLMVNAVEAMPEGGVIGITARETSDCVLIAVEDTGPGIPAGICGRLFEPFVSAGKKEGLGLGLALSRQAVRDHGGDLWYEPAAGARFVISLPLDNASVAVRGLGRDSVPGEI